MTQDKVILLSKNSKSFFKSFYYFCKKPLLPFTMLLFSLLVQLLKQTATVELGLSLMPAYLFLSLIILIFLFLHAYMVQKLHKNMDCNDDSGLLQSQLRLVRIYFLIFIPAYSLGEGWSFVNRDVSLL